MNKQLGIAPQIRFPEFKDCWQQNRLGDIVEINPKTESLPEYFIYIDLESVTNGELLKESEISKNDAPSRAQRVLTKNDVLFQMVRPYQKNNYYFIKNGNYVASTGYAQLRTNQNSMFIYQYLHNQRFVNEVILRCTGTSYPAINSTDLSNIEISLPSLPEQIRIASFFTVLDNKIAQLKQKKNLLEQYKKGVMQKLFSQELRFKDDNGKEFSKWEKKKLGELGEFVGGGTPTTKDNSFWNGDIPWLSSSDLTEDSIYKLFPTRFITKEAISKSATKLIPAKSILIISRVGVGKVAINKVGVCTSQDFISLIPLKDNHLFLAYLIKQQTEKLLAFNQGTSIKGFVKSDLVDIQILLPSIKEQTKIANYLSAIDEKINRTENQIQQTQEWKKGLLQNMFC